MSLLTHTRREEAGDVLSGFRKTAYCSLHTTAGYLEQGACRRLGQTHKQLDPFIRAVQKIFRTMRDTITIAGRAE